MKQAKLIYKDTLTAQLNHSILTVEEQEKLKQLPPLLPEAERVLDLLADLMLDKFFEDQKLTYGK